MSDHNARARAHHDIEALLNLRFGKWVNAGGRLVEDKNRRGLQQHTRQRDQLALPKREPRAALANLGLQALRQIVYPLAAAKMERGIRHILIAGIGPAVANV